jgi:DNA polymerase III subunit gamma/tau
MADAPFVSLYRRFRPGRFDELRGQDHVVRALRSAVRDNRVSHAYLFSGPRGTGKTSSARILAKALNCEAPADGEPCGACASCREITQGNSLNVHELDAASNNGVDAMRDLVAHAGLGTPGRWKVYIVDEVHMLSTAAANALLKTLEEPPGHVVFVLATTDPQKVPPTIRSRTQHLEFRLLGSDVLHDLLESVNAEAGLEVGEDALEAAVRRGRGSARDALSALDQVVASGSADAARPELAGLLHALSEGDAAQTLVALNALLAGGWGPQHLATELIDDLRQIFLAALAPELCAASGPSRERYVSLAEVIGLPRVVRSMEILGQALVDMREAPDTQVVLEIAVVRSVRPDLDSGLEALAERVGLLERTVSGGAAFPRPPHERPAPPAGADQPERRPPRGTTDDVGSRPSIGAVRRRQQAAGSDPAGGGGGGGAGGGEAGDARGAPPDEAGAEANASSDGPETDAVTEEQPTPSSTARPGPPVPTTSIDRDTLTEAWGDGILQSLPARAKARFASGHFVAVDEQGAHFALPHAAHRDQCAEQLPIVEAALEQHFGTKVALVLVVDDEAAPPPARGTAAAARSAASAASAGRGRAAAQRDDPGDDAEEIHDVDPSELAGDAEGGQDQASAAQARLMEAFPGASEVAG